MTTFLVSLYVRYLLRGVDPARGSANYCLGIDYYDYDYTGPNTYTGSGLRLDRLRVSGATF